MFPRVPDQHKIGKPLIPNGLGVAYVLFSIVYLFSLEFFGVASVNGIPVALTLAVCILFGGFMGLLDDWMDLKWRYKAFMPLIAALPLIYYARAIGARTTLFLPYIVTFHLGSIYFYVIIPIIVMIVTNTVNMLGGLNGLESICPAIVIVGLMAISHANYVLMVGPILFWLVLAYFNFQGKIFVGNSGSFAIGMTIAAFAVISDLKTSLLITILPYIFNSSLILLTVFFTRQRAKVIYDGNKLCSDHRRSLITLITYNRPLSEKQVVRTIALIVAVSTALGVISQLI